MVHKSNNKDISDRVKRTPFETEEEFQDTSRVNAKPSEPSRNPKNQPSTRNVKKGGATDTKKL
jgi:hypothetical protein